MISSFFRLVKAVSIFLVGMAFFLSGCQPKVVRERPVEKAILEDAFYHAEGAYQKGNLEEALEGYQKYLDAAPGGEKVPIALLRMAGIYSTKGRHDEALQLYVRIMQEYPDRPEIPEALFDLAKLHYRLGDYSESFVLASRFFKRYPTHPLRGEILILMGHAKKAAGEIPQTFFWWQKAQRELQQSPKKVEELAERLSALIQEASIDELKEMSVYAAGTAHAPQIYHRLALIHLGADNLEAAKQAAMDLVRSSTEQRWVSIGRKLLERLDEELSVNRGAIGCLLPLSGPFAIYGQEVLNGIQLGLGIFNEGSGQAELELIIKDTRGSEADAVRCVEELVMEAKVMAIIGPLASKPATAAAKKAQELGVPIITLTQKDSITTEGSMVFRNFLTPSREINSVLDKVMDDKAWRSFGILYPENSYGRFFMNLFWDRVEEMGGIITAVESYKPDATDFAEQVKKMVGLYYPRPESVKNFLVQLKAARAEDNMGEGIPQDEDEEPEPIIDFDAVFIPDNYQQVALIAPQFPFNNVFNVHFLGTSLWQSEELIELAGDYVQGSIFPSGFFRSGVTGPVEDFAALYRTNFEGEPGILAATGYDTMMFLKSLLGKKPAKTRQDFRKRLLEVVDFQGLTGKLSFDPEGEVIKDPVLLTIAGRNLKKLP